MKIEGIWKNGNLCFKDFIVVKEKDSFWGVYEISVLNYAPLGKLITSGETLNRAAKKAKLLQIGYNICRDNLIDDCYF